MLIIVKSSYVLFWKRWSWKSMNLRKVIVCFSQSVEWTINARAVKICCCSYVFRVYGLVRFCWSLKNLLVLIYSKLHSKSCDYLYIAIAKCQRAKILPIRSRCSICLELSWTTPVMNYRNLRKIVWIQFECTSKKYLENSEPNCSTA